MRGFRLSLRCTSDFRFLGLFFGVGWFVTTYKTKVLLSEILTIEDRKDRLYLNVGDKSITHKNSEKRRAHSVKAKAKAKEKKKKKLYLWVACFTVLA